MLLQSACRASPSAVILEDIARADCNLAVWQRPAIPGLAAVLDGAARDIRFSAQFPDLAAKLDSELDVAGYAPSPLRDALARDIGELAGQFCAILGQRQVELRLEIVTGDSCRKFHGDYVHARLITTYVGTGTQWIDEADAKRVSEGLEPRDVHTLGTGDVGLFKGKLTTDNPAIHRSPPISGSGETRLLLVLNPGKSAP